MNKLVVVVFLSVAAYTMAAPAPTRTLPALRHEEIRDEFGQYALRYITAEGSMVTERGHLVLTPDGKDHVLVIDGEVTYISDDGKTYVTKYSAGLDGFKVEADHLPVAPLPVRQW